MLGAHLLRAVGTGWWSPSLLLVSAVRLRRLPGRRMLLLTWLAWWLPRTRRWRCLLLLRLIRIVTVGITMLAAVRWRRRVRLQ